MEVFTPCDCDNLTRSYTAHCKQKQIAQCEHTLKTDVNFNVTLRQSAVHTIHLSQQMESVSPFANANCLFLLITDFMMPQFQCEHFL